jgi:hypothetical protein
MKQTEKTLVPETSLLVEALQAVLQRGLSNQKQK